MGNLMLLLSKNVLTRPWVLVEIVTAVEAQVPVVPVLLLKGFDQFRFPDDDYFDGLLTGKTLSNSTMQFIEECGIDVHTLKGALQHVFKSIAVPYSPHRPASIRQAELQAVLQHCNANSRNSGSHGMARTRSAPSV